MSMSEHNRSRKKVRKTGQVLFLKAKSEQESDPSPLYTIRTPIGTKSGLCLMTVGRPVYYTSEGENNTHPCMALAALSKEKRQYSRHRRKTGASWQCV